MSDIRQIADKLYESKDEYISVSDASLSVNAVVTGCESKETIEALAAVLVQINHAPRADVAPIVHGHWVVEDLSVLETYTCSVCKHVTAYFGVKYCPECGAKMDESEESGND